MSQVFPAHWDVLPFSLAVKDATSEYSKLQKSEYLEQGRFPIVDQGQNKFGGYTNDESVVSLDGCPAIVFGDHTRIFKFIDEPFCLGADGAKVLEPKVELDRKFLFYYLSSLNIESAGYSRHFKFLKENVVPVPPLPEQKRIAAILDKADAIRRKRQQAIQLADDFLRAVFLDMFGDPVTNPKGWEVSSLDQHLEFLTSGSRGWAKYYSNSGSKFIRIQNVGKNKLLLTDMAYVNAPKGAEAARTKIQTGDVLLSITADLGRSTVVTSDIEDGYVNQHLAILRLKKYELNSRYLSAYLSSDAGVRQFFVKNKSAVKAGINFSDIRSLEIQVPPISLQRSYENLYERVMGFQLKQSENLDVAEAAFSSLSQKAFSGQL